MYLCFIDESQTPPKPTQRGRPPYFIIAGVIIHEDQWSEIANDFKLLKKRRNYNIRGEIKWRYFGPTNADPQNSVSHLDQEKRNRFREEMFLIITRRKAVRIIACVSSVTAAYKQSYVHDEEDLYTYTYKCVSERFQYFLQDIGRTIGSTQRGIMVADHRGRSQDERLRLRHHDFIDNNVPIFANYANYVETIFLTPSHHSVGIQFADMVAGAIGRKFNSDDPYYYNLIESSLRRSTQGKIEGYGIAKFPTRGWQ